MIDKIKYKITINGIAANQNKKNNISELVIKMILQMFIEVLKDSSLLNLKENSLIFDINSTGRRKEIISNSWSL